MAPWKGLQGLTTTSVSQYQLSHESPLNNDHAIVYCTSRLPGFAREEGRERGVGREVGPVIFRFKKSNFPFQKKGNSVSIPFHYCQN